MAVTFYQAFESAVQRYSSEVWSQLDPRHQTEAIYEEIGRWMPIRQIRKRWRKIISPVGLGPGLEQPQTTAKVDPQPPPVHTRRSAIPPCPTYRRSELK